VLESGGVVAQETRGWNEQREASFLMRLKEAENDYRYFPDPDLVPMVFEESYIERLRSELPELPLAKLNRYRETMGLSDYDANQLTMDKRGSEFFEEAVRLGGDPKSICNWMISDLAKLLNDAGAEIGDSKVTPAHLVQLTTLVASGTINGKTAKRVIAESFTSGRSPDQIVSDSGDTQISDRDSVLGIVREVLAAHPDVVEKYKGGQINVLGFLVGQVMKSSGGRANPKQVQELMKEGLDEV